MSADLEDIINQELEKYREKKQNIEQQIEKLPITLKKQKSAQDNDIESQNNLINDLNKNQQEKISLEEVLQNSKKSFDDLSEHSQKIYKNVNDIQKVSTEALKDFEKLKYRKINVEILLNTMSAFQQLQQILPNLEQSLQEKNISNCIKQIKIYNQIKDFLLDDLVSEVQKDRIQKVFENSKNFAKSQFEIALSQNNQDQINYCSLLQKELNIEETSLDKILESYSKNLQQEYRKLEDEMFTQIPTNYTCDKQFFLENHYQKPFLQFFINIQEKLWEAFESYQSTIVQYYNLEGLFKMLQIFIEKDTMPVVHSLFKKMNNFYMLDKINTKEPSQENIDLIGTYSIEVTEISNSNEDFNREIVKSIIEIDQQKGQQYRSIIDGMGISNYVLELLGNYINYQNFYLRAKIQKVLENSQSFNYLYKFNKQFFRQFMQKQEQLANMTELCEFIDQIFYIVKHASIQALETLNKSSAQAIIQQISNQIIYEQFMKVQNILLDKYIIREYFHSDGIQLTNNYTVDNSVVIILFNNIEMSIKILKKLKQQLYNQVEYLYTEPEEEATKNTLKYCLDELEQENIRALSQLQNNKMNQFCEYIKITIKDILDEFKSINFAMNEALLMNYEQSETFSKIFKNKMRHYLQQWKVQFTNDNFDLFIEVFATQINKSIEQMIFAKKFHQLGGILLDKEIRNIITFFQSIADVNVKQIFQKLLFISEILMLENYQDVEDFYELSLESKQHDYSKQDMVNISRLRIDFNVPLKQN